MPDNDQNGQNRLPTPEDVKANSKISPLPPTLQHRYESELQTDLSSVRIHQGHAPTLMGSQSFTSGQDIFFAPGQYQPHSEEGRRLLAHELSHVVQQRSGGGNGK